MPPSWPYSREEPTRTRATPHGPRRGLSAISSRSPAPAVLLVKGGEVDAPPTISIVAFVSGDRQRSSASSRASHRLRRLRRRPPARGRTAPPARFGCGCAAPGAPIHDALGCPDAVPNVRRRPGKLVPRELRSNKRESGARRLATVTKSVEMKCTATCREVRVGRRARPPVRLAGPLVGGARGIPADHLARSPPGQAHQVALLAAGSEPAVRERVPEPVRVDVVDPGLGGAAVEDLPRCRSRSSRPFLPSHSAASRPCGCRARARR